jgi:3-mercaptopropionate dioxygenase
MPVLHAAGFDDLLAAIRCVTCRAGTWADTARGVATAVRRCRPSLDLVDGLGDVDGLGGLDGFGGLASPDEVTSRLLHAEPDGAFSVVVLVCPPGCATTVHDHVSWGVVAVLGGREHEQRFTADPGGRLRLRGPEHVTDAGRVTMFVPPHDIHRVRNAGPSAALSLHVYGTDIARLGSSTRRVYLLPPAAASSTRSPRSVSLSVPHVTKEST